jgi:hypothetical protein
MIKKYIIRTIAALALAFVLVISASPNAKAAAPNSLAVFTGFQPYGGTITPALGVGGVIDVVPVPGLIPVVASPYNSKHLDTDNNGSPDSNSTLWATAGNYYNYSFTTKDKLIWCGNSGGVPDGQFRVNVSLVSAPGGASDTQLNVGGVVKTGRWSGEWWRQGEDGETWVGFSTYFTGRTASIVALNPGLMVVKFTFIEDPPAPPPTYIGQIETQKRMNAAGNPYVTEPVLLNAKTQIYQANGAEFRCGNFFTCSNTGLNSWATGVVMWVNPAEVTSNDNSTGYLSKIDVPFGYRVNRVQLSRPANVAANTPNLSCTGSNNTGTCSTTTKVWNQDTTFVDWFLEKIPVPIPYYPWLQTKNGDVTSANNSIDNGKITGQRIGSAADFNNRRGARRAGTGTAPATVAESSFVVAATVASDYFCAQERFVLGKPLADRDNFDDVSCQTGGYTPSPVNFDKVKASIAKAYADNGNGVPKSPATPDACNPKYATGVTAPSGIVFFNNVDSNCPAGGIRKIDGDATINFEKTTVQGRGTVWVTGDLTINKNITYGASTNDPKTTPNLVIFVEGNVFIGADVTQIDASIISMKTISTCTQSGTPGPACSSALVINGFLASGGKIDFARRYYAAPYATATPSPAELINLTSQSTTFPAPGLDRTDIDVTSKLQINGGEFAPRLN